MSKIHITKDWLELKNAKGNTAKQLSILKKSKESREIIKKLIGNYITEVEPHFFGSKDKFINNKMKQMLELGYIILEHSDKNEAVYLNYFLK